ncbi:DUF4350 domain-containing protein [Haloarcula sp. 1CSR25-25]|uniref:DUF4350 domain-containing protein n=1 Tax=Haloarcula sp. 1CSR25-25 TaxID=2862545 RepID=UPI00289447C9|nr:DUF4350 domain-containing protein [Haloarcula sp. 1CSR25-25]MDT3435581.1 DUF4350 domain-containing protein [Haloarcula sp. 1CSR25-25]
MFSDRSYPRLLLLTLLVTVVATLLVAAGTSSAAFGVYNSQWDGTAEVRTAAEAAGAQTTVVQNTSRYDGSAPNETVAVVLSPTRGYHERETAAVRSFVRAGGTLLVAEDYGDGGNELLSAVGASARIDGRPLRDERQIGPSPAFPRADVMTNHTYTTTVDELMLNHGSAVNPGSATVLATASEYSYLDTNRNGDLDTDEELMPRPVVTVESVGSGTVLVVSDPSIFLNSMLDRSDNAAFLRAVVGAHDTVLLDVSHTTALPPLVALRLLLQQSGLATFLGGCLSILALFAIAKSPGIARQFPWRNQQSTSQAPGLSSADVSAAVQRRHPDWDEERVNRVTDRLMKHRE